MQRVAWLLAAGTAWLYCQQPVTAGDLNKLDDVIAAYVKALGGQERLDGVKSMRMVGKVTGQGMEFPMTMEIRSPDKIRIEFTFQGMTGTQAFDGSTGWFVMPFAGKTDPEKMPPEMAKIVADQADLHGPLVDYQKKGHKVELMGKEDLEGAPCYKLKVNKKSGDVEYYFLDAEQLLPVKVKGKRDFMGSEMEFESNLADYKSVDGLMIPHSMQQSGGPMGMSTMTVEKIELNPKLPDERFAMPAVKPSEPSAEKKDERKEEAPPTPKP